MTLKDRLMDVQAKRQARENEPAVLLGKKLGNIILPAVNFREAALVDVVAYLEEETKSEINFVIQIPATEKVLPVTLSLRNVSVADVLKYLTELTKLAYRVDAHAVVIYKPLPNQGATSLPATANVKPE